VDDRSDAYFRRLIIIRFNKQFAEREQNKNLSEDLLLEAEGILIWCLEGLKRLNARGRFDEKGYLQKEIAEYRVENNNVILFVNEECALDLDASIQVGVLYANYVEWCKNNGCHSLQKIRFGKEIKRQFKKEVTKVISTNGVHIWCGIKPNFIRYTEN
jgi:putative DNA primase/helicase